MFRRTAIALLTASAAFAFAGSAQAEPAVQMAAATPADDAPMVHDLAPAKIDPNGPYAFLLLTGGCDFAGDAPADDADLVAGDEGPFETLTPAHGSPADVVAAR